MKKNLIGFMIVFVLTIVAIYLVTNYQSGTIKKELKDFAVKDTTGITRIFLADRRGNKVTLDYIEPGKWNVNGKFLARRDAVNTLMKTISTIQPYAPVPKASFNNVIKTLAAEGIKVEIYKGDEILKTYYVGGNTPDNLSTYMMIEGSSAPFAMHIPGFNGYLSTRYITDESLWKSTAVFEFNPAEIASIKIDYPQNPQFSFEIASPKLNEFHLLQNGEEVKNFDTNMVKDFVIRFNGVNYEGVEYQLKPEFVDSVLSTSPLHVFKVTDRSGNSVLLRTFLKKPSQETFGEGGKQILIDKNRMYGQINNARQLVLLQYFVFDKLTLPITEFLPKGIVKK